MFTFYTMDSTVNIMLMHCHKHKTDALDLTAVDNDFKEADEQCKTFLSSAVVDKPPIITYIIISIKIK